MHPEPCLTSRISSNMLLPGSPPIPSIDELFEKKVQGGAAVRHSSVGLEVPISLVSIGDISIFTGILTDFWLVVWTPLKNISQLGWLFPIYGKIKNVPNHQPDL